MGHGRTRWHKVDVGETRGDKLGKVMVVGCDGVGGEADVLYFSRSALLCSEDFGISEPIYCLSG